MSSHITQLLFFIVLSFGGLYLVWKLAKIKGFSAYRLFDLYLLGVLSGVLFARLGFMIVHLRSYLEAGFSLFPFYTLGTERVWFEQLPWSYFKFWEGLDILGYLFAPGLLFFLYMIFLKKTERKFRDVLSFPFAIVTLILMLINVVADRNSFPPLFFSNNDLIGTLYIISLILAFVVVCVVFYFYIKEDDTKSVSGVLNFFLLGVMFLVLNFFWPKDTEFSAKIYWVGLSLTISIFSLIRLIPILRDNEENDNSPRRFRTLKRTTTENGLNNGDYIDPNTDSADASQKTTTSRSSRFNMRYSNLRKDPIYKRLVDSILVVYYKVRRRV